MAENIKGGHFMIKINGKIQRRLQSRALKARKSIKKRSKFLKVEL